MDAWLLETLTCTHAKKKKNKPKNGTAKNAGLHWKVIKRIIDDLRAGISVMKGEGNFPSEGEPFRQNNALIPRIEF